MWGQLPHPSPSQSTGTLQFHILWVAQGWEKETHLGSGGQHRAMPWEPGLARVFSHESGLQWFEKLLGVVGR